MGIEYRYQNWRREGTRSAVHGLAMRMIKPLAPYRALYGMQICMDQLTLPDYPPADLPYETRFLDQDEVLRCLEKEPILRPDPTHEALARGDRCYAVLDGDRLASYGWYATRPLIVAAGLYLDFDPAHAYMHTGYTHGDYRGERLHGIGMARALETLTGEGSRGLVSCVDTDNLPSLRSCARMGYRHFGVLRILGKGERAWSHVSAGCAEYGFTLSPSPESALMVDPTTAKAA